MKQMEGRCRGNGASSRTAPAPQACPRLCRAAAEPGEALGGSQENAAGLWVGGLGRNPLSGASCWKRWGGFQQFWGLVAFLTPTQKSRGGGGFADSASPLAVARHAARASCAHLSSPPRRVRGRQDGHRVSAELPPPGVSWPHNGAVLGRYGTGFLVPGRFFPELSARERCRVSPKRDVPTWFAPLAGLGWAMGGCWGCPNVASPGPLSFQKV